MKRILVYGFLLIMLFTFASCGETTTDDSKTPGNISSPSPDDLSPSPHTNNHDLTSPDNSPSPTPSPSPFVSPIIPDISPSDIMPGK